MSRGTGLPMMPPARRRTALAALATAVALAHLWLLSAPRTGSGARTAQGPHTLRLPAAPVLTLRTLAPPATNAREGSPAPAPTGPAAPTAARQTAAASTMPRSVGDAAPTLVHAPPNTSAPALPRELLPDPPAVAALPGPLTLRFQLSGRSRGRDVKGQALLRFQHDGQRYEIRHEIQADPPGVRLQTSEGLLTPQGLAPRRFGERRRTQEAVHFDPVQGQLVFSAAMPTAALMPGAQDRLSVLLQLGALIAAQPGAFGPGRSISLQVASAREAAVWRFTVVGEEDLALPGGPLRALHLVRPPQREFEPRLDLWLAPGRAYVPVRLRLTGPDGDWLEQLGLPTDKA